MSAAPEIVADNELAFFFQTNEPVPAKPLLDFLFEVDRLARTRRHFGPDVVVEIVEVITGTKLVKMTFDRKIAVASMAMGAGSLAVAVAAFGNDISQRIQQPSGRLADNVARMCLDHGVAECVVTSSEGQVRITRDNILAVRKVRDRREAAELGEERDAAAVALSRRPMPDLAEQVSHILRAKEPIADLRSRDGRVYTLVGRLQPATGRSLDWRFTSQSGTDYIATGVNPSRSGMSRDTTVVIRADVAGKRDGVTILNVKDVFEPEEP